MTGDRTDQSSAGPIVLVVPTVPLPGANGLAMRAGRWLDALAAAGPVHVVVVPLAGSAGSSAWARVGARSLTVVDPVGEHDASRHVTEQLADAEWRAALEVTAPLPPLMTRAPPSLAREVAPAVASELGAKPRALLVMREYLVPFGITLARELGAGRVAVDLDDDVEPLLRALGRGDEADAYGRLARSWLPSADVVTLASVPEARAVAQRYGLVHVAAVPNSVAPAPSTSPRPGADRLLFVGNLTYRPNVDAVAVLAREVLPRVRRARAGATLDLVGHADDTVRALAACDGVNVHGFVGELDAVYTRADVVVMPIAVGAGTRIKVLDAFAHRRPVVATRAAVEGLVVEDGRDVLLADGADALAGAVLRLLGDTALADRLVVSASITLHDHYAPGVVAPLARRVVLGDEVRAE